MRTPVVITQVFILSLLGGAIVPVHAQSLADVAKQEEERRKTTGSGGKVYSNKDLKSVPPPSPPSGATTAPASPPSADASADSKPAAVDGVRADAGAGTADSDTTLSKGEAKDQAYWSSHIKSLRDQLDHDRTYLDAMQTRLNELTTEFYSRDDPAQRVRIGADRQKALSEFNRLKKAIDDDGKAIDAFEEQARRASVPPGWLR